MKNSPKFIYYNIKDKSLIKKFDYNYPVISSKQILLKVNFCGICGSDIAMINKGSKRINKKTILGHEIIGTVIEIGKHIKDKSILHDRFCLGADIKFNCLKYIDDCEYCKKDNANLCNYPQAIGHEINGGFANYIILDYLTFKNTPRFKIPNDIKLEAKYALTEPLACCINAFKKIYDKNKNSILIFGLGPMGYLLGKLAIALGYKKIIYIEKDLKRINLVKKLKETKFRYFKDFKSFKNYKDINEINQVIVACKSSEAIKNSFLLGVKNYQINFFSGIKNDKKIGVSSDFIHYNQISITGTHGSTFGDFKKAFNMISKKIIDIKKGFISVIKLDELDKYINNKKSNCHLKLVLKND